LIGGDNMENYKKDILKSLKSRWDSSRNILPYGHEKLEDVVETISDEFTLKFEEELNKGFDKINISVISIKFFNDMPHDLKYKVEFSHSGSDEIMAKEFEFIFNMKEYYYYKEEPKEEEKDEV
jgi:hypothetical protein